MLKNKIKKSKKKGFTLIELIIVIAILAILALILVPAIGAYRQKAEKSNIQASAKTVMSAIQAYNAEQTDPTKEITAPSSATQGLNLLYADGTLDSNKVPSAVKNCTTVTGGSDYKDLEHLVDNNFTVDTVKGLDSTVK